ncbi:DHH family phosphoesterase [Patescibacteria group bacterium]|nr:DHH family phosphoesterase [Patescibacteria group bacterium]MBU1682466.1 DHH family phosphoesterase [Patescibacteria group bacterium]
MDTKTTDQVLNLIDKSQNILLLTHAKADCDGLGAMLSSYLVLKELGKNVTAVTNDPTPENLAFLPSVNMVQNSLMSSKDFIITLDLTNTALSKIKYNLEEDNRVNIIITPKGGVFTKEDVSFSQGNNKFDLIIIFDTGNLEHLGPIYDKNSELFFETPIINIDHHASNTDFGQVNIVDVVAASTTEVLFEIFEAMEKKYDKKFVTKDIATLLLAGIITDTGSFQHANTSPRSMEASARLLDLGGRQQEIIKNIYKTKKLSTLKLWGVVLSKVQVDPIYRMVWSTISREDLKEANASSEESEGIIDDLLTNAPGAEVIMLIKYNDGNYISVSMRSTTNSVDVGKISAEMGGGGHVRAAGYKVRDGRPFDQVVSEILEKVRQYQGERLSIHPEDVVGTRDLASESEDKPQPRDKGTTPQRSGKTTYLDFEGEKERKVGMRDLASKDEKEEKEGKKKRKRKPRTRKRTVKEKAPEKPKTVEAAATPAPVVEKPKPVAEAPVAPAPETVAPTPAVEPPITPEPAPEAMTPQPETAPPVPEAPVVPQPEVTPPTPEPVTPQPEVAPAPMTPQESAPSATPQPEVAPEPAPPTPAQPEAPAAPATPPQPETPPATPTPEPPKPEAEQPNVPDWLKSE